MPTLPDWNPEQPSDEPHRHRDIAESFGTDVARYDRARPGYPQAMADAIIADAPGSCVLDVGIGSGISARPFATSGFEVLGVEPDARMAEGARKRGFDVDVAKFEDWDPAGRVFDCLISGQTWHWIDPVAGAAKAAVVLRPGGRIALFWNVFQPEPELAKAFDDVYQRVDTGLPFRPWALDPLDSYHPITDATITGIRRSEAFGQVEQLRFDWEREYTHDEWLDLVPTAGGHNRIAKDRLDDLLTGLSAVIHSAGGRITMGYATIVLTTQRLMS